MLLSSLRRSSRRGASTAVPGPAALQRRLQSGMGTGGSNGNGGLRKHGSEFRANFAGKGAVPHAGDMLGPTALLNQNVRNLDMSPTVGINEMQAKRKAEGKEVYRFGFGQSPFPVPQLMQDELAKYAYRKDYLAVRGLKELRDAVAKHVRQEHGVNATGEDVLITPGSKEGVFLLQLAYYGELLLPSPSWVSYAPQAQIIGRHIKWIPTSPATSWKVDPEVLQEELEWDSQRPRILVLNSPSNPTGKAYSEKELKQLADICREHRVLVLSDEIYGPLMHDGAGAHRTIATHYPEGTILMTGISKWAAAGGWRLGAFVFPSNMRWMMDSLAVVASETFTCTSAPIQHAAVPAWEQFHGDEMQHFLWVNRKVLSGLAAHATEQLLDCGATVLRPDGGFYLFPDFGTVPNIEAMAEKWASVTGRRITSFGAKEFTLFLLGETGVAGLGGSYFGRGEHELSMRLTYTDFNGERVLKHADEIPEDISSPEMQAFLEKYCPKVMTGYRRLSEYMKSLS